LNRLDVIYWKKICGSWKILLHFLELKAETIVLKNKQWSFEQDISCWSWKVEIMDIFNKQIRGRMDGANAEDLQALHRVVFGVVGAAKYRKRNLIQFDFLEESEEFYAIVKTVMGGTSEFGLFVLAVWCRKCWISDGVGETNLYHFVQAS
jgi:hypothetical protein